MNMERIDMEPEPVIRVTEVISAPDQGNPSFSRVGEKVTKNVPYDRFLIPPGVTMKTVIYFDDVVFREKSWKATPEPGRNAMGEVRLKVWTDAGISDFERPDPEEL